MFLRISRFVSQWRRVVFKLQNSSWVRALTSREKHYIANEQETHRLPVGGRLALSSVVDDTTLHEIYLWPFVDAIHAEVASIMCSYNR